MKFLVLVYWLGMAPQPLEVTADDQAAAIVAACKASTTQPTAIAFTANNVPTRTVFAPCWRP